MYNDFPSYPFRHRKPLTEGQIELLNNVKPLIIEEAQTFDMTVVVNDCGTPSCIAGHCGFLLQLPYSEDSSPIDFLVAVETWFDTHDMRLFYLVDWERSLSAEYCNYPENSLERAQVACQAIDAYISNTCEHFAQQAQ